MAADSGIVMEGSATRANSPGLSVLTMACVGIVVALPLSFAFVSQSSSAMRPAVAVRAYISGWVRVSISRSITHDTQRSMKDRAERCDMDILSLECQKQPHDHPLFGSVESVIYLSSIDIRLCAPLSMGVVLQRHEQRCEPMPPVVPTQSGNC